MDSRKSRPPKFIAVEPYSERMFEMESNVNERNEAPFPLPWFERVGPSGFAAGGAAIGFVMSLMFVLNSAPGAATAPTPLLSAQPRSGTETQGIKQSVRAPVASSADSRQVELMPQPVMSPSRPTIAQDHDAQATRNGTASNTDQQSERVARQEPPTVAATTDYQNTPVLQHDTATGAIDPGNGTGRGTTGPSTSLAIPAPRTEYRRSATTQYRSSARIKYRSSDQRSADDEQTARSSEQAFGTTATGIPTYVGPRGGIYHYSASGRKVYQRKR